MSLSLPVTFTFYFYCYTHPRALHSFPTRRSSDLYTLKGDANLNGVVDSDDFGVLATYFNQSEVIDRKSTRLNSSHVSISYAVFCLKKKNFHMNVITSHSIFYHEVMIESRFVCRFPYTVT